MKHRLSFWFIVIVAGLLATAPILTACDATTDTTTPTSPIPFSIDVIPVHMEDTIAGQSCVFLVTVANEVSVTDEAKLVNISATATDAKVTVGPKAIAPGSVAEVVVVPEVILDPNEESRTLTVTVNGERDGLKKTETVTVRVVEGEDSAAETAANMRDKFIPWLAENYPELNITSETEWTGTIVLPNIEVVVYYLFFAEEWEMGVRWNATTESSEDWVRIYLRQRTAEVSPSHAFEISSASAQEEPQAIEPPESVWR
jgi:hypothetical protein